MAVEVERLEGIRQEIPFYFKGKLATADSSFEGDIVLITNGGEYTIPYSVKVIHKYIETSKGRISTMEEFVDIYRRIEKRRWNYFSCRILKKYFWNIFQNKRAYITVS